MRKPRHNPTAIEEAALAADLALLQTLGTKALMRKYDVSRTVITRMKQKIRLKMQNVFIDIHAEGAQPDKIER